MAETPSGGKNYKQLVSVSCHQPGSWLVPQQAMQIGGSQEHTLGNTMVVCLCKLYMVEITVLKGSIERVERVLKGSIEHERKEHRIREK